MRNHQSLFKPIGGHHIGVSLIIDNLIYDYLQLSYILDRYSSNLNVSEIIGAFKEAVFMVGDITGVIF